MLPPLSLTPCLPTELLSYVLEQTCPTTLIICDTRTAFLTSLLRETSRTVPEPDHHGGDSESNSQISFPADHTSNSEAEDDDTDIDIETSRQKDHRHPLLISTLHQIFSSRHVNLAFIPTVSHLRAYLSVFSPTPDSPSMSSHATQVFDMPSTQAPQLVVYGLLKQHRATSEWSTQGLGNTLAGLVEAGVRTGKRVVIIEERTDAAGVPNTADEAGPEDIYNAVDEGVDRGDRCAGEGAWHEKLPILNGSLRRAGADMEYTGRTIEVGVVLRRWFRFGRREWDHDVHG